MKVCARCGKPSDRIEAGRVKETCKQCRNFIRMAKKRSPDDFEITVDAPITESDKERLFRVASRRPMNLADLCDAMDMSPKRVGALIAACDADGKPLRIENGFAQFAVPRIDDRVQETGVSPVTGERQLVGVISDLHYGSKYCRKDLIADCVAYLYSRGVRDVLVPGDILDGNYTDHGLFELSHVGLEDQVAECVASLPVYPGLRYHAISGNHDETFQKQNGANALGIVAASRTDFTLYGHRGAFLHIKGATIHLWHPMGGGSYARSYKLQKRIEGYAVGEKPDIILAGHWHQFCYIEERGVHGIMCPTFQGGGSNFGKALVGAPSIGGLLLSWDLTAEGTLRSFVLEKRTYFEKEVQQCVT